MCIEERFKKYILEEFKELKKDGFTIKEETLKTVSDWKSCTEAKWNKQIFSIVYQVYQEKFHDKTFIFFWSNPCNILLLK